MRIAIVGAGAVGSVIAGYLLEHGQHEVSLLARGPHLGAIRERGLLVLSGDKRMASRPLASDDPQALGPQDAIIITVKAHALPALAPRLAPLLGPGTLVVSAQNGVPWWYFYGADGPEADTPFDTVDPGGAVWRALGPERAIGCVINIPASITEPGVAHHAGRLRLHLGAPRAGEHGDALAAIVQAIDQSGIACNQTDRIRDEVWSKLLLNNASGTVSVLTGRTMGEIRAEPALLGTLARLMRECLAVAHAWGIEIADDVDAELAKGVTAPRHKTSMLQDYEAGRPLELGPIVTAVIELARRRQVPVPTIESLWALTRIKLGG
ncbi:MAG TPA: 2-dehydropantoate 2-reductase [Aliidongia sp.]|uniref:ketopantoate reductase family protein n=1 Tax=Aliidongia sp. TaxID=1914230 RepID=UPI002DDD36AB|nr:2-dehydropantoate 2-reductase [Aliidongia sp.]HEV2677830.1 2-dehydropantoate 2-reductase [Aliidongia sp.]